MVNGFVQILAQVIIWALVPALPVLYVVYTDRFHRMPEPREFGALFSLLTLLGVLLRVPALAIVAGTGLAGLGLARLSARYAFSGLVYERRLAPARLFPGDEGELTVRVDNRKLLPLAWMTITDPVRAGMARADRHLSRRLLFSGGIEIEENQAALVQRTALGPFQGLIRRYRVIGLKRGVYGLGPAQIEAGDPFGLFPRELCVGEPLEILVYPHVYTPDEIGLPFREAIGEVIPRRALVEDPTLLAGSREYRPGDPLQRMHWKSTARTGELQVRVFDPSTTASLLIVINLNTYQHLWHGVDLDRMEATIDVAASLAMWALDKGYPVGVRSNGLVLGMEGASRVSPSANVRQASIILEHLARISYSGRFPPEYVLMDEVGRLDARTSIVFVTPLLTPELISILSSPRLKGRVSVVYSGRHAAPVIRGLPVYLVTPPAEVGRAAS